MAPLQGSADRPLSAAEDERNIQSKLLGGVGSGGHRRLYGREAEAKLLTECYEQSQGCDQKGIVLVTGASGTGKTELARSLEPRVQQDGGFFLHGKCDQLSRGKTMVPYSPFAEAFGSLVEELLRRADEPAVALRGRLRQAITDATRDAGFALLDAVPAFQKLSITRSTSANSNSPGLVAQPLCKILMQCCGPDFRLVLLLDDLQWLDSASLALFESLSLKSQAIPGFLLLGTCRGNEVALEDPLAIALRNIEGQNISITDIRLNNLSATALQNLLKETFQVDSDQLADLVFQQTQGNLFFALQFVRNLYDTKVLHYNVAQKEWILSSSKIHDTASQKQAASLDCDALVAAIMTDIMKQSPEVELVLKVASCLGAEFAQSQLQAAAVNHKTLKSSLDLLEEKGVIQRRRYNSKAVTNYRWVHDRFQKAAYGLISPDQRVAFHIATGLKLLHNLSELERRANPFVVVNQFCHPTIMEDLPRDGEAGDDLLEVARLFLLAGDKACASAAFLAASAYLRLGMDLLMATSSHDKIDATSLDCDIDNSSLRRMLDSHYDTGVALCNSAAYAECCVGNFDMVDKLVAVILDHDKTQIHDMLRAYETQIISLGARQDLDGAVRLGIKVLREIFGEVYPKKPNLFHVVTQVLKTKFQLGRMTEADILALKPATDKKKLAACRIMILVYPASLRVMPQLAVLLLTRGITLTLKYGLSIISPVFLQFFASILAHPVGDIQEGQRLASVAMQLMNKEEHNAWEFRCRTLLAYWGFTHSWSYPIHECLEPLKAGAQVGTLSGDFEMVCLSYFCYMNVAFLASSRPLPILAREFAELNESFAGVHQETILFYFKVSQQAVQSLQEPSKAEGFGLSGDFFQERSGLEQAVGVGDQLGITTILIFKCFLSVYFNKPEEALATAKQLRKRDTGGFTVILVHQAVFLCGLAEVMAARASKSRWSRAGKAAIQKLKQYAVHAPENTRNKILLIEAHRAALRGRWEDAFAKFQLSIQHARQSGFLGEESLACEQAGMANLDWGERDSGVVLLRTAQSLYERWGAMVKVEQIASLLQHV